MPVLTELAARGWTVHVRTLASAVPRLQAAGIDAAPIAAEIEQLRHDDWKASSPIEAQKRSMDVFARRAPLDAADLGKAVSDVHPAMVLVDVMALGALAAAEASGLPWATWLPYPAWIRRPGVPPYGPGLRPLGGPIGTLRDAAVARIGAGPARRFTDAANAGRQAVGLDPIASPDEILLRPPCVIAMTSPALEYPGPWPGSFHLVGPMAWDPPSDRPAWLTEDHRPIVLVSTSSEYQRDDALLHTAFEALGCREDLRVVGTLPGGDTQRITSFRPPPNGRVERFIPHSLVLPSCAVVICHGGAGITHRALAAGVPVVSVPFGRDQLEVARRAEVGGGGVRLSARRLSAPRLLEAFEQAAAKRRQTQEIARQIAHDGGAAAAADAIEAQRSGQDRSRQPAS